MKFRRLDYIIFYVIAVLFFTLNLAVPFKIWNVISCFILALIPALIFGTITNLVRLIVKKITS